VFVERIAHGEFSGGYLEFMTQRVFQFRPYPAGDFSWHHLWFIVYLFAYVLLLTPLLLWWRKRTALRPAPRPGFWLFALSLPLGINESILKPIFPETHNLTSDWYIFNHYLLLTVYGYLLASMNGAWDWLAAKRRIALGIALALSVGGLTLLETGVIRRDTPADSMFANVFTWVWLMTFFGYGRAHLSFGNRFIAWARDASYPVYILHQTVIIVIAYFVIQQPWSPWTKYGIVLAATLLICVLAYELLLRRFAVLRAMFGIKIHAPGPAQAPGSQIGRQNPDSTDSPRASVLT
jgi:glucans biosynthesis protein C